MEVHVVETIEGEDAWLLARLTGPDGTVFTQATVTSWDVRVYDLNPLPSVDPKTPVYSLLAQMPSAVLFNTLQTDQYWRRDSIGYNFRHQLGGSLFPTEGGHVYRVSYKFVTGLLGVKMALYELHVATPTLTL